MLLVANLANTKWCWKMTETLTHGGYWSENNQWELTTEYQYDRFEIVNEKSLRPYALDESSRIIGRVKENLY